MKCKYWRECGNIHNVICMKDGGIFTDGVNCSLYDKKEVEKELRGLIEH